MNIRREVILAAAGFAAFAFSPACANEGAGAATKAGVLIGASAGVPPPGIYMFDQAFTYQAKLTGPGTAVLNPNGTNKTSVHGNVAATGLLFVPGWTFLGGTYDAVVAQPFVDVSVGTPVNAQFSGRFNTYVANELSWKLGESGFAFKAGLGVYVPVGTITGINGLGNVGSPYWTFQPEAILSYLKDGWNLSVAVSQEINTANSFSHYTSGNILHADFTATKTIGKWTFGPVAYYVGQVSNDSCPASCIAFYGANQTLVNYARSNTWAVGGLLGYDFGPASLSIWATQELMAKVSNPAIAAGADPSTIARGSTVFATLSYRVWAPDEPPKPAMYRK